MLHSLLLGTWSGVYRAGAQPQLVALPQQLITHLAVAASGRAAVVAVPRLGRLHDMYRHEHPELEAKQSGLHLLRAAGGEEDATFTAEHVWEGDARSAGVWELGGDGGAQPQLLLAVGTEPADVFSSQDGGRSWSAGTDSFAAAPTRAEWSFPVPPHVPHVLSIEALPGNGSGAAAAPPRLVAGIEVGGVMVSGGGGGTGAWEQRREGLYPDVHSCRIDPHDPAHWLVVSGKGLYVSRDSGETWRAQDPQLWAGRYTIGLAFNPQQPGEVLITAGDKPPALGVHVYHSTDGGESWREITEEVFSGAELQPAKGERTPVPYFLDGQALLGTSTGHLLASQDAGRRQWRVAARLPHPITCMAGPGQSPASIMH